MKFLIKLDESTSNSLNALARKRGTTSTALIRHAVSDFLDREAGTGWPNAVKAFTGEEGLQAFEASRRSIQLPGEVPLA